MNQIIEMELKEHILIMIQSALAEVQPTKEWLTMNEGAAYCGVSINTFKKFREDGLKVFENDGVKRVSVKEIDRYMNERSC